MKWIKFVPVTLLAIVLYGCNHCSQDDAPEPTPTPCHGGSCHASSAATVVATPAQVVPQPTSSPETDTTAGALLPPPADAGDDVGDDLNFSADRGHIGSAAVVVGINKYPGNALQGCVNDAEDMCMDIKSYGVKRRDIKFLSDAEATTENIRKALVWLAVTSKPQAGDIRVFTYSGHGAEDAITPDAGGEPDHLNQIMCPVDFDWSRQHMLVDKDLVAIFAQMPAGVCFYWLSDSCHSGDLDKGVYKKVNHRKQFPATAEVKARVAKVKAKFDKKELMHRNMIDGHIDVGFLSGCKSDETSADTQDDSGRPCGALTNAFLTAKKKTPNAPIRELAASLDSSLDLFDQHPQAEGPRAGKAWMSKP